MSELELVRLHEDGERLVLRGPGGQSFTLPIDESLRAAVRRDRASLEQWRATGTATLSPREIQSNLRSGMTAQEVADAAGVPVEHVRRFEGPVLAEQEYVVARLLGIVTDHDDPAPRSATGRAGARHDEDGATLGDRIAQRLTVRGIAEEDRTWSASRAAGKPWIVTVSFPVGERTRTGSWSFDPTNREHHAIDDESRWLGEPETAQGDVWETSTGFDAESATRPILAAVDAPVEVLADPTSALLDDLRRRRGVRQDQDDASARFDTYRPVPEPEQFHAEVSAPVAAPDPADEDAATEESAETGGRLLRLTPREVHAPAEPAPGAPGQADEATRGEPRPHGREHGTEDSSVDAVESHADDAGTSQAAPTAEQPRVPAPTAHDGATPDRSSGRGRQDRRQGRKGRAKVPSWDEIMFGAKHD